MFEKLSVCIPAYNNAHTIAETIDSVRSQSFSEFEIIVLDDHSSDDTIKVTKSIPDIRINVIPNDKNYGLAYGLNMLKLLSNTDIIVYLSADDILLPGALQAIYDEFSKNPAVGIVIRPYYWFQGSPDHIVRRTKMKDFKLHDLIFLCGQSSGIGVRKSMIKWPFQQLRFVEFASVGLKLIKETESIILKEPNVYVRIDSSDARKSHVYNESPTENWCKVIEESFVPNMDLINYLEHEIGKNYIGLIQIKSYGGEKAVMDEIKRLIHVRIANIISPKFWFYSLFVLLTPSFILRGLSSWFVYNVNQWFVRSKR